MKQNTSSLLLIEIILSVFFLSLASIVCVRFFSHANTLSQRTEETTQAVIVAQNLAEAFRAGDDASDSFEAIEKLYPHAVSDSDTGAVTIAFDEDWKSIPASEEADYHATLSVTEEEAGLQTAEITVVGTEETATQKDPAIYTLTVSSYREEVAP
ncbi:MAG: hypothetical protein J5935_05950 [Lachnospiraceae bacterium]|nr:hypothetical protein [Lachnospiraceae bacterium]